MLHFIRVYTPLILSILALLNAFMYMSEEGDYTLVYLIANMASSSLLIDFYILSVSSRMCIWYKLNILCLILIHISGLLYNVAWIDESIYLYIIAVLSTIGIIFFLVFHIFYRTIIKNK
jgi:hypothetical protein